MTSQSQQLKQLKEQLKGKIFDLKISEHLLGLGDRKPGYKEKELERMYGNLEAWIFENIGNIKLEEPEDDIVIEPDTNDPSLFPAEGSDLLDF